MLYHNQPGQYSPITSLLENTKMPQVLNASIKQLLVRSLEHWYRIRVIEQKKDY
ncbi:hypothetical protein Hanom_Chr11g01007471 [Helianthus anomalus]